MPRPKSFDEDVVLDQAVQLFWARGYEGTSLADLETHLGLGRQSLYNTFGDKQSLFLKVLERYRRNVAEGVLAQLNAPDAGLDAIRAFFKTSVESLTAPGPRRACLVTNTILERGSESLDRLQPIPARGGFEPSEVDNAEFLMNDVDLFGFEAGDRKHVEEALRHVATQLFQQWVRTAPVQPGEDVGDRRADARYIAQSVMTDDAVERLGQRGEAVRRAKIGFRAEIIVACERRAPAEFDQQNRYGRGV